jgi:S-DNA-T family DNA segregation ATPase FtsK/SpoIIIE
MKKKRTRAKASKRRQPGLFERIVRSLILRPKIGLAGLFVLGFGLALALLSFDPADPPSPTAVPANASPTNFLGLLGSWVAQSVVSTLGQTSYVALAVWFAILLVILQQRPIWRKLLRITGWLILVPLAATWATVVSLPAICFPDAAAGGRLGIWIDQTLRAQYERNVELGILAGVILVVVVLCLDSFLRACAIEMVEAARFLFVSLKPVVGFFSVQPAAPLTPQIAPTPVPRVAIATVQTPDPVIPPIRRPQPVPDAIPIVHQEPVRPPVPPPAPPAPPRVPPVPIKRPVATVPTEHFEDFELPPLSLLDDPQPFPYAAHDQQLRDRAALLAKTFADFGLNVRVVGINTGPVITQYEVSLETGLRVNKVTSLGDDLALNLKVPSVRIVAPIPGKNTVGIEVPNETRAMVRLKEVILTGTAQTAKAKVPLFLGKDTEGGALIYDLAEMPHLLIAGRTGTGKSVCMNTIILSILMTRRPDEVKMIMIDPKMLEMSEYGRIPHLMHPVVKDMKKAEAILGWAVDKMEERYELLSRARVRNIASYNELEMEEIYKRVQPVDEEERQALPNKLPYIIIFVDEMNDLMMTMKKEVEGHIIRLAQKSRAAGIHLVVATQKPTVDVITGLIKSNLPARICFQVSSRSDSRVVLDEMGADKLLGKGDMLFLQPGTSTLTRSQGAYASDQEITRVIEHLECDPCFAPELMQLHTKDSEGGAAEGGSFLERLRARDEVYEQAIEVVIREGRGSVSLLQRALGIGYGRAARLVDFMAEDGIVGNYNGSQARDVMYTPEQWEEVKENAAATAS